MSKKFYEASVWSSAMRSRRNAKAIIDSNAWEHFIIFTFKKDVGRDYYKVKEICLKWKRALWLQFSLFPFSDKREAPRPNAGDKPFQWSTSGLCNNCCAYNCLFSKSSIYHSLSGATT